MRSGGPARRGVLVGIQPPTEGPYVDSVTMVAGDTLLYTSVCCPDGGSDHEQVIALAQEMAQLAAPSREQLVVQLGDGAVALADGVDRHPKLRPGARRGGG